MTNSFVLNIFRGIALLMFAMLSGNHAQAQAMRQDQNAGIKKYNAVMQLINYAYVDTVNEARLV